ncbi:6-phosphogluconolactonase [Marinobacterium rhizophilum]|uniref:6-phosphogluconolactonase n=1 Tax=Marinobacterium rhizophilum TaxID=420402 RepID=A0ABY5HLL2_9GAMM|nr:6-phosphogluconolactonase [Marinobacterium rhizophilum]UTW12854.1 6-phosphogluconolactonase [Marinobacterium rhizophilum]
MNKSDIASLLPQQVTLLRFDTPEQATQALAEHIRQGLAQAVDARGEAAIALSGGRTPIPLFQRLSKTALPWSSISVTLADDRWLATDQADSNAGLIKQHLLQHEAQQARFISLWQAGKTAQEAVADCAGRLAALPDLLDMVVLGMGNDGHTASLFPCASELEHALVTEQACAAVVPTSAPHARMTLSARRLLASRERILHLKGTDKLETLQHALLDDDIRIMPIRLFLRQPLTIYWSP